MLGATRVYRGGIVSETLLDWFEQSGLLPPKVRLRWPDDVKRRFRAEKHQQGGSMVQPLEPEGPRWEAAVGLFNHLQQHSFHHTHKPLEHPFDDPKDEFLQFLESPDGNEFVARKERRFDVSKVGCEQLFSSGNIQDFYSSWQLLIGIEAADMGVRIRVNMAASRAVEKVYEQIRNDLAIEGPKSISTDNGISKLKGFSSVLDAIVFAEEEGDFAMLRAVKGKGRRFVLEDDEFSAIEEMRKASANNAREKFVVEAEQLFQLAHFLAQKTTEWDRDGRPFISHAYKQFLAGAVKMLQRTEEMDFDAISKRVGRCGSGFGETLKQIWPDWNEQQKERVIRTLKGQLPTGGSGRVSEDELDGFADFLIQEHQHGFLLHLEAFEHHAFNGAEAVMPSMANHFQGMAVAVEHVVRAMGNDGNQLYNMFKNIWSDDNVGKLLKKNDKLARQGGKLIKWHEIKAKIETIAASGEAGSVVADLILAHKIRGAVHYALPEENQLEKERMFIALMRAAVMTHAHLNRAKKD